jgi:putative membrane protein
VTVAPAAPDDGWARLHPLTPLLRGGRFVLVVLAVAGQQGLRSAEPWVLLAVFGVGVPLAVFAGWISWRRMRYRLTATELQVESGVLTTRSRRVPLARLQSVDVVRPLLARLLGLAELRMEVVGGGAGAEAPLSYLSEDDAEVLRARLLHLAAGREDTAQPVAEPPQRVLVVVPPGPLVWSTLLGAPAVPWRSSWSWWRRGARRPVPRPHAAAAALPMLFGAGSFAVRRILDEYGFTVAEASDGLRLQQGLLDTRSSTIPPGRVQTVRSRSRCCGGRSGWVRVEVDVAGYAAGGRPAGHDRALLPVARASSPSGSSRGCSAGRCRSRTCARRAAPGCAPRRRTAGSRSGPTSATWCRRTASPPRRWTSCRWRRCRACGGRRARCSGGWA